MVQRSLIIFLLFICSVLAANDADCAKLFIHSKTAVAIEIVGFNSLAETSLFKGNLKPDSKHEINTSYRGLALLVFAGGQSYPVIIGDESFPVTIANPAEPPSFANSAENDFFYKALTNKTQVPEQYAFASLMIQAKYLLDSSHSIRTAQELRAGKKEFQQFVAENYQNLRHSDMIRRLLGQYFMMHEYVDYHIEGAPASNIKKRYQKEILTGVADWLKILSPHISEQEILNYCVSLYYNRSMVTLASLIVDTFKDAAYCPGDAPETLSFPDDLQILAPGQNKTENLGTIKGNKLIAFVSEHCPVSMVAAVSKARKMAKEKQTIPLIVAPLEKLSGKHLAMSRMIRNGKLLFVSDEKWRKENLTKKIKLPLFINAMVERP